MRVWISIALFAALAACGDGNPFTDADESTPDGTTNGIPESLSSNLQSASYNPSAGTLQLRLTSLDAAPIVATYARTPVLDVDNYQAFTVQDDPLDRHFTALVAQSGDADRSVKAGVVGDGGQFNRFYSGGFYERSGVYDPPGSASAPVGLVSYAGSYAGVTNLNAPGGPQLLPVPGGTDPSVRPAQAERIDGDIFLNVDFGDGAVNGSVSNRRLIGSGTALPTIVLVEGDIASDGTFLGTVEYDNDADRVIGDFGGIFGGTDASAVGGIISMNEFFDDAGIASNAERERGVFVLIKCGLPGDDAACP
jgi:hypothetical protein